MFVILETGGKQYRVSKGSIIDVEKVNANINETISFNKVLFIQKDDNSVMIGNPILTDVLVEGNVIKNYKDNKVVVFKKRRRKNSKRKNGHRQLKTRIIINDIKF